jgi:peroxiredoxin Q/BCP
MIMVNLRWIPSLVVCAILAIPAAGAELEVGMKAPEFELPDHTGKTHKLSDYKGKRVVLAFYPAANTAG